VTAGESATHRYFLQYVHCNLSRMATASETGIQNHLVSKEAGVSSVSAIKNAIVPI